MDVGRIGDSLRSDHVQKSSRWGGFRQTPPGTVLPDLTLGPALAGRPDLRDGRPGLLSQSRSLSATDNYLRFLHA